MVARLRSDKGSFVRSAKGAFVGVAPAVLQLFCTLNGVFNNIRGGDIATNPCYIRDDTGAAEDGYVRWELLVQGDGDFVPRLPTFQEMLDSYNETTWQGDVSGLTVEMGGLDSSIFCTTLDDGANGSSRVYEPGLGIVSRSMFLLRGAVSHHEVLYFQTTAPGFSAGESFTQIA